MRDFGEEGKERKTKGTTKEAIHLLQMVYIYDKLSGTEGPVAKFCSKPENL